MSGPKTAPEVAATRAGRQARIVALLSSKSVRSQSELAAMLADEGIDVTQATLSRDLDELGAVKLRGADGGVGVYIEQWQGGNAMFVYPSSVAAAPPEYPKKNWQ